MWRYRDWVIKALNRDMQFDQFTIEQLTGDLPAATSLTIIRDGELQETPLNNIALDQLIATYELRRIVLLGDFLHAASPGRSTHADKFAAWRATHPSLEFGVIAGNHDRRAAGRELAESVAWHLNEWQIGPFVCRHHPGTSSAGYVLAGHIHPVVFLYGSHRERTRVPVCWVRPDYAVLPSFGSFTGGGDIEPEAGDRLYAFAADRVWSLPAVER